MNCDILPLIEQHGGHPSAFLSTNKETKIFTDPAFNGFIAYRPAGKKFYICFAGVIAGQNDRAGLLKAFYQKAKHDKRKIIAVQFLREDAELLTQLDFRINQLGASYCLSLEDFTLKGTRFMKLRNKISRARRLGIEVLELGKELAYSADIANEVKKIDQQWLVSKGSHKKELDLLIGEVGDIKENEQGKKRLFFARLNGDYIGYILYTPSYGQYEGWMHDLSRKVLQAPPGVMELINITALERFSQEGAKYLNFGFTPLTGLSNELELPGSCSKIAAWVIRKLSTHGTKIYPAQSQLSYKQKWNPGVVLPEYVAFQGGFSLSALWNLLKATRAI